MKKKTFLLQIIVVFFTLANITSCQKDKRLELPDINLPYVLNCTFAADSTFKVKIYKTISVYDNYNINFQKELNPIILDENNTKNELNYHIINNNGIINEYYSNSLLIAEKEKEYSISFLTENNETVTASSSIPEKPEVIDISLLNYELVNRNDTITEHYGYSFDGNLQVIINNNRQEEKFYAIILYYYSDFKSAPPLVEIPKTKRNINFYVMNELNQFESYANKEGHIIDYNANNQIDTILIEIDTPIKVAFREFNTFYVEVKSINKDYYLYQKTIVDHVNSKNDPFSEAVPVYTNINNGIGIFAGCNSKIDTITIGL